MFISLSALAIAVSLDGFGVGITYGLRKIRIPFPSILVITALSSIVLLISMQIGQFLSDFLSAQTAKLIGALILISVGCWAIFNISRNSEENRNMDRKEEIKEDGGKNSLIF